MTKNQSIIGRVAEKVVLDQALSSKDPELVAVYGRRRIGKTFLIREYLKHSLVFEVAGMHEQNTISQLAGFHAALRRAFPAVVSIQPRTWFDAFEILRTCLEQTPKKKHKRVIFFDEFPWLATRKSNFLAAFENFWNDRVFRLLLGLDAYKHSGKLMDASRIPPPENLTQPEKSAKFA